MQISVITLLSLLKVTPLTRTVVNLGSLPLNKSFRPVSELRGNSCEEWVESCCMNDQHLVLVVRSLICWQHLNILESAWLQRPSPPIWTKFTLWITCNSTCKSWPLSSLTGLAIPEPPTLFIWLLAKDMLAWRFVRVAFWLIREEWLGKSSPDIAMTFTCELIKVSSVPLLPLSYRLAPLVFSCQAQLNTR